MGEFIYLEAFALLMNLFCFLSFIVWILWLSINKCFNIEWFLAFLANMSVENFLRSSRGSIFKWIIACLYFMLGIMIFRPIFRILSRSFLFLAVRPPHNTWHLAPDTQSEGGSQWGARVGSNGVQERYLPSWRLPWVPKACDSQLGGEIKGFTFKLPGPDHCASWMSKCIYFLKIRLVSKVFSLIDEETK